MTLILLKAPVPTLDGYRAEGMDVTKSSVDLGQPPPWIMPHCWSCQVPVERFTIDWIASPFYLPIQFSCHGKTGGMKIPYLKVREASNTGGILWVFTETKTTRSNGRAGK